MRTFLTLVPDADTAVAIDSWCALCWPGLTRRIPVQNYHMTLAFLGDTDSGGLALLADMLEGFSHPSFDVCLNEVGFFADIDLLWIGSNEVSPDHILLQSKCARFANRIGAKAGTRKYIPHMTLARKVSEPPAAALVDPDFSFTADRLELWQSERAAAGARYTTLASWQLV